MLKQSLISLASTRTFANFVSLLERYGNGKSNLLRVLTYHRVDELNTRPDLDPGMISATPDDFAQQMVHLARHYRVVHVDEVIDAVRGSHKLPPRSVLLTFDDAYCDFAAHAWPVLQGLRLPSVLFVPTAYPDSPTRRFWWDRLYQALFSEKVPQEAWHSLGIDDLTVADRHKAYRRAIRRIKELPHDRAMELVDEVCLRCGMTASSNAVLSWNELRQLASEGVALAPHTRTHPLMDRLPVEEAVAEAVLSYDDLRREIKHPTPVLAYPAGSYNEEIIERIKVHELQLAFTTCRGINDLHTVDRYRLRRINVGRRTPRSLLRAQLLANARYLNGYWKRGA